MDELEYERRMSRVEDRARSNQHRLDKVERAQENITALVESVASIAQRQEDMDGDMKEIKTDVKTLASKPGQRWESVVEKVLLSVVAALVGWCMVRLGFG